MNLDIINDIRSINDLKQNTSMIIKQIHETRRPIVLTNDGKAEAVLLDAEEYEKISQAFNLLKLLIPAEKDIQDGNHTRAEDFFKSFKNEKNI